jgi:thymidylate synthase
MRVLHVRNVHRALPAALELLHQHGESRSTRNGPVLQAPWPVTTVYQNPTERVLFWPQRDANPFFHLYESLWMLAGREDVEPLTRYAKQMKAFSDDGETLHGAYGRRWRKWFSSKNGWLFGDQLGIIIRRLKENPEDRRCVLQMWDAEEDLNSLSKDVPCNTMATFQRGANGELNMTVFCRSNDIVWGAYGANAVHFSMLLEYMALAMDCQVGIYTQVSVNWHGYLSTLKPLDEIPYWQYQHDDPYSKSEVYPHQMYHGTVEEADRRIAELLHRADHGFDSPSEFNDDEPFFSAANVVLTAHHVYKNSPASKRYDDALAVLKTGNQKNDWITAATQWVKRRKVGYEANKPQQMETK